MGKVSQKRRTRAFKRRVRAFVIREGEEKIRRWIREEFFRESPFARFLKRQRVS
jgi:hypothetical protein